MPADSSTIIKALRLKHADAVFVDECKNGPSQTGSHLRMDAWVMEKSWANPCVTVYEVKVSRSDFLNDKKWTGYMKYCNQLYFAAPKGLISKDELPSEVGLIELLGTKMLRTAHKAVYREVEIPESIFRYILMCRARIGEETDPQNPNRTTAEFWKNWLAEKEEDRELGYQVARTIRETCEKLKAENESLHGQHETYERLQAFMVEHGIIKSKEQYVNEWNARTQLESLKKNFPDAIRSRIKEVAREMENLLFEIDQHEGRLSKIPASPPTFGGQQTENR